MKQISAITVAVLATTSAFFFLQPQKKNISENKTFGSPMEDDARQRLEWEYKRLAGPDGTIPVNMREKEIAFSSTLPTSGSFNQNSSGNRAQTSAVWNKRGPWNVGGRTRAFVIDKLNEQ